MNLPLPIMESILNKRFSTSNLRNFQEFATERKISFWYGLENLSYRYPQLCSLLPEIPKEMNSLIQFKNNVRHWICTEVVAVYVQVIFKILDFYNVIISYTFVKLAYLATSKLKTLFIYFLNFCRKTIFQLIDCK